MVGRPVLGRGDGFDPAPDPIGLLAGLGDGRAGHDGSLDRLAVARAIRPRRITFLRPRIVYRVGEDGRPIRPPLKHTRGSPTPVLIAEQGRLTVQQAGRPEMVVESLGGRLDPELEHDAARFRVKSADAGWGSPAVDGRFGPGFQSIQLRLTADRLPADREKAARIPFVSKKVWNYFAPTGPVRVVVDYERPKPHEGPSVVKTVVDFERTRIVLPHLKLTAKDAEGRMIYEDQVVRLEAMRGEMVEGRVEVGGSMDFRGRDSRYALTVDLKGTDLDSFPTSWGLKTVGLSGRLTGAARLRMELTGRGLDVTGSKGDGIIEDASIRGIPLGRLGVNLRGEGLRADADVSEADRGVFLPQWIGSDFEVRDVELKQAIARVGSKNGGQEVPVSGRLGLKLALRMPLGTLRDLKAYRGEGTADLAGATIGNLSLGRLAGRLDLSSGVLELVHVRGRLVERPDDDSSRPGATDPPPSAGPLPVGGFRGRFRADLAASEHAEAEFEGHQLPMKALMASAEGSLSIRASARGTSLSDPRAWSGSGRVEGPEVGFRSTRFREVSASIALKSGRLDVSDLAARLDDHVLKGEGEVDLAAPHAFRVRLDASGLPLADLLATASSTASKSKASGTVAARAEASGTLGPLKVESRGRARVDQAEVSGVPIGDVPIAWETRGETVVVTAREVQRYGGRLSAEARVPVRGDRPVEGTVTLDRVDTARLSAEVPGSLRITGLADGQARFRLPLNGDGPPAEAEATLKSSRMTVEGIPATALRARLVLHDGVPRFEAHAEGLEGTFTVKGSGAAGRDRKGVAIDADVRAVGFHLLPLWDALGLASGRWAGSRGAARSPRRSGRAGRSARPMPRARPRSAT